VHTYRFIDLGIASEIRLPGLLDAPRAAAPEILVQVGEVPAELPGPTSAGPSWQIAGDTVLLTVPGVGRFLLTRGREVTAEPAPGLTADDLSALIAETVLAILMQQRGEFALSASAVAVNGRAVLFCGPSGAGKSTIAALLGKAGYPVLADDLCAIDASGEAPLLRPDGCAPRLWEEAARALRVAVGAAVRPGLRKHLVGTAADAPARRLTVAAVYRLADSARPCAVQPLRGGAAVQALTESVLRPQLTAPLGLGATAFEAAVRTSRAASVAILSRRRDLVAAAGALDTLRGHWRALGLSERDQ
jgi:hypothetical protein